MQTPGYASLRLRSEVIERGLCPLCTGCSAGCPYLGVYQGRVVQLDCCTLDEGSCYRFCPRTRTDLEALSHAVFDLPLVWDDFGIVRKAYFARAKDAGVRAAAGGGGVVPALLRAALSESLVGAVVGTGCRGDATPGLLDRNLASAIGHSEAPVSVLVSDPTQVVSVVTAPYHHARTLAAYNSIPKENSALLGMTCLPCQTASIRKRLGQPADNRVDASNVRLLIGESCATKRWLEPGEDRQSVNKACSYCWDLTGEFADVSVGSGRGQNPDWNIVFVRTEAGEQAFGVALDTGAIEIKALPDESLTHEKKASREKKLRAIRNLVELSGSPNDLLYLELPKRIRDALGSRP
ncbi:MAG: Coenzyme F420 hydrogenase/dehydrogenase, beta subunit C-terminal domain [Dehalococcoidia bacterium]|nr:Coenzyme F420 hydrogenase/dehydrogenase, beta subunit C-terminal domain [Dehalococcoidia bacterium]